MDTGHPPHFFLHRLERATEVSPGLVVAWFCIPFTILWKPYQAALAVQHARPLPRPLLPIWWTFWLLSIFVGRINFKATMTTERVEELIYASQIHLANCAVDLPLSALAFAMVINISRAQTATGQKLMVPIQLPVARTAYPPAGGW